MKRLFALLLVALFMVIVACSGEHENTDGQAVSPSPPGPNGFSPYLSAIWRTDFSRASVTRDEFDDVINKDWIPSISEPRFLSVVTVDFLADREPVIAFREGDDVRAYPIQILIWHEIVNDLVGGRPVLITFCPLCNTAIAFDRTLEGRALDFGVTGYLRNSDLVMYDRETESWWQQATGEAIVGTLVGARLELLPSTIVSWADFKTAFPHGLVLSQETGYERAYGANPYEGYDDIGSSPILYRGPTDGRLAAVERVVGIAIGEEAVAYPFSRLKDKRVVSDTVGGTEVVIFFKPGTASALDRGSIANSRDVGSAAVFRPAVEGTGLTFRWTGSHFVDHETESSWDILGRATAGPLRGKVLEPVVSGSHFWFAWAAFEPHTRVWGGG